MRVEIRKLRPEQVETTVDVWVRARWDAQPWLEERLGYTNDQNLVYFRDVICVEHEVWAAVDGATVLGLMALTGGEIDQLHVAPEFQGQGVGSALLTKAHDLSPEWLSLFTHQRNEKARRFYEARGFSATQFGTSPPPESEPDVRYEWRHDRQPRPAA
jgi:ribosomal protein S18 acetylase RimI-like enzyme